MEKVNVKFDGIWDAERVLINYLAFSNDEGYLTDMSSWSERNRTPYFVRQKRLLAALKAYERDEECFYPTEGASSSRGCVYGYLISATHSKEKIEEFCKLIEQNLPSYYVCVDLNAFNKEMDIRVAFEKLFEYRKRLYALERLWSGVLGCRQSVGMIYAVTNRLYQDNIKSVSDIIDRMLILLMGDDYDQSFSEKELLKYGYPNVTDDEIQDLEIETF